MPKQRTTICLPPGLSGRAQEAGINISKTCAKAVSEAIRKLEAEAPREGIKEGST